MELNEEQVETLTQSIQTGGKVFDVLYIGGGVAALSGAIYSARDGLKTLVLEGIPLSNTEGPGGALMLTSEIENFPGFFPAGSGADLVDQIREQAVHFGADIREELVEEVHFSNKVGACHKVITDEGDEYLARSVVIATGAKARLLGIPGEDEFLGRGVSTCGTCDGAMFNGLEVVIVGGGDTACEDVLLLTRYASKVTMLVRGDKLRSAGPEARIIAEHPDVEIRYNSKLVEIHGDKSITHVTVDTEGTQTELSVQGVFIAIGSDPTSSFLKGTGVKLDDQGYVLTNEDTTVVSDTVVGVFAAGDVADKVYRQAITSAGKGVQAALEARHYLNK